jgi:hypothetical protein
MFLAKRDFTKNNNPYKDKIIVEKALTVRRTDERTPSVQSGDSNTTSWPTIATDNFPL